MSHKNPISIVIICFNMNREIHRTLYSLSHHYQRFDSAIEIILIDTGSEISPKLEEFRYLSLDVTVINYPSSNPSPVHAINEGISRTKYDLVGVLIDGARLASPGILNACQRASQLYVNGIFTTRNYQLGPDLQYKSLDNGYSKNIEDDLLKSINWEVNGYRLFEISTAEHLSHDNEPLLESNAIFMRKHLWKQLGGYDPLFTSAGGGAANPDLLKRACDLPETLLVRLAGEATFHQIHHGVTTSSSTTAFANLKRASHEYYKIRGVPLSPVKTAGVIFKCTE
jgi:hypothetical protein